MANVRYYTNSMSEHISPPYALDYHRTAKYLAAITATAIAVGGLMADCGGKSDGGGSGGSTNKPYKGGPRTNKNPGGWVTNFDMLPGSPLSGAITLYIEKPAP